MDALLGSLETDPCNLINWFCDNYFQINADKCHLLISKHSKEIFINIEQESSSVKLLGVTIDNKLNFDEHITKLCKKASQEIHALARISNFMSQEKLCIIMKAFIESQFGYCPLIWRFHSRTLNNRINRLHERAHEGSIRILVSHFANYYAKTIHFIFIIKIYRYLLQNCTKLKIIFLRH